MTGKKEPIHIRIFDEASDNVIREEGNIFDTTDFGGTIPLVGDLIAIPTLQEFSSDPGQNPRLRRVIERYFWPSIDPKISARVNLLVGEQRARKSSRKITSTNRASVASASRAPDIPFMVQQIFTCLKLSKECGDVEMASSLRKLAEAFADRAIALGADPKTIPIRGTSRSKL